MKRGLILEMLLFVILFVLDIYALNVDLTSPVDNAIYVDSNTVVFKCRASGQDLRFIELYNNIGGWGKKAEVSNPQNNTDAIFSVKNISNGNYAWNCKVIDGVEGVRFSSLNRSFSISIAENNPPIYSGGLTHQSWNMNAQKNNAFDLDNFFSDPDGNTLTYSVNGNANINVNIDSNNIVSFSQAPNWFGTERVYFTASDGKESINSNYINLTVIKLDNPNTNQPPASSGNTQPKIEPKIPDQNKSKDSSFWFLDLINYAKDNEEDANKLNWSVESVDTNLIKVDIDNTNKRAKFTIKKPGSDAVSFILTDSSGLSASQNVKITIYESKENTDSDFGELVQETKDSSSSLEIKSHSPLDKEITLSQNQVMAFTVDLTIQGDIEWYLDNTIIPGETKNYFSFNSVEEGAHNLTVYVSDLDKTVSNSWDIIVKKYEQKEVTEIKAQICGNNVAEENENCSNCEADIKCQSNQICESGICKEKSFWSITGNVVSDLGNKITSNVKKTILYPIAGLFAVALIGVLMIRRRNKKKYSQHLKEFEEKKGFFKKLQKKLRDFDTKRKQKKADKINLTNLESKKIEEVKTFAPSVNSISGFIKESMNNGHSKKAIKKALREKGWSRIQIWKAFKKT